jgi:hypothetical protein
VYNDKMAEQLNPFQQSLTLYAGYTGTTGGVAPPSSGFKKAYITVTGATNQVIIPLTDFDFTYMEIWGSDTPEDVELGLEYVDDLGDQYLQNVQVTQRNSSGDLNDGVMVRNVDTGVYIVSTVGREGTQPTLLRQAVGVPRIKVSRFANLPIGLQFCVLYL